MKFLSNDHRSRFIEAIETRKYSKKENGSIDIEYGTAFYILASSDSIWEKSKKHLGFGIDFPSILKHGNFSSGERLIVYLAQELFTGQPSKGLSIYNMVCALDEECFNLCLMAMCIYKNGNLNMDMLGEVDA